MESPYTWYLYHLSFYVIVIAVVVVTYQFVGNLSAVGHGHVLAYLLGHGLAVLSVLGLISSGQSSGNISRLTLLDELRPTFVLVFRGATFLMAKHLFV